MRTVREQGQSSLGSIRERLKLPHMVLEPVFRQLRQQAYLDVKGIQGNDYHFGLTTRGQDAGGGARVDLCLRGPCAGIPGGIRGRGAAAGGARAGQPR